LTKKAEETAVEHEQEIKQALQKAEATADQRTGGKYHDQIQKAGAKADTFIDGLKQKSTPASADDAADEIAHPGRVSQRRDQPAAPTPVRP
jgi:DNA-binding protein H-NS